MGRNVIIIGKKAPVFHLKIGEMSIVHFAQFAGHAEKMREQIKVFRDAHES